METVVEQADEAARAAALRAVLDRARGLVPTLREWARRAELLRRMPDETVREFRDAAFYRILQPARYGGLELDYGCQTELAIELGRGCASSAWDASITACHAWIGGMYPGEAQDEVWGDDPETMISTSFLPMAPKVERVAGGIRVDGRWGFSSGIDHCRWVILAFDAVMTADALPEQVLGLVPLTDCDVEDTWHVTGLAATGSNTIHAADVLIPDHRILRVMEMRGEPTPGSAVNADYIYRLPLHAVFSFNLVGTGIGAALGAVESVIEAMNTRRPLSGVSLAEQQSVQLRIGEARARVDAAHALVMRNIEDIRRRGRAGGGFDLETRLRYRTHNAFAARSSAEAVDGLFPLLGGRGLADDDPVNRAWRDAHAVAHHAALSWDIQGRLWSAVALGLPSVDPRV